jgi:hypothetical protein
VRMVAAHDEAATYAFSLLPHRRFRGLDEPRLVRAFGGGVLFRLCWRDGGLTAAALQAALFRIFAHPAILSRRGSSSPTDDDDVVVVVARVVMAVYTADSIELRPHEEDFFFGVAPSSERVARRCERGPV